MNENPVPQSSNFKKTMYCLTPILIYIAVNIILSFITAAIVFFSASMGYDNAANMLLTGDGNYYLAMVMDICLIIPAIFFRKRDRAMSGLEREKASGAVNVILAVIMGFAISLALNLFVSIIGADKLMEKFAPDRVSMLSGGSPLVKFIALCIFAPIAEELIFRVLLFGRLRHFMSFIPAAVVSAVCFGIVHLEPVTGVCAFVIGLVMAYLFENTGSIFLSMFFHFGFNLLPTLAFLMSGGSEAAQPEVSDGVLRIGMLVWFILGVIIFTIMFIIFIRKNSNAADMTAADTDLTDTEKGWSK